MTESKAIAITGEAMKVLQEHGSSVEAFTKTLKELLASTRFSGAYVYFDSCLCIELGEAEKEPLMLA